MRMKSEGEGEGEAEMYYIRGGMIIIDEELCITRHQYPIGSPPDALWLGLGVF